MERTTLIQGDTMAKRSDIAQAVEQLVKEKQSVTDRERTLIDRLNAGLRKIGYQVTPLTRTSQNRAAAPTRRGMSASARKAVSQRMRAYWAKRRAQKGKKD
jgi:hypothetical protein